MRKYLGILLAIVLLMPAVAGADFRSSSIRLDGINSDLLYLLHCEPTEIYAINGTRILDVDGYRLYTNLSNHMTGTDTPIDGATVLNDFLIGGIMPLAGPLEGMGNAALMFNLDQDKDDATNEFTQFTGNIAGLNLTQNQNALFTPTLITGVTTEGEYNYENVATVAAVVTTLSESGEAYNTLKGRDVSLVVGLNTLEIADVAIQINNDQNLLANGMGAVRVDTSYEYSYSRTVSNDALDYINVDSSRELIGAPFNVAAPAPVSFSESGTTISLSARKDMGEAKVGLRVGMAMLNAESSDVVETTLTAGQNISDANYAWLGALGLTSAYSRIFTLENKIEAGGNSIGGSIDVIYPLSDTVNVLGFLGTDGYPLSGDGSFLMDDNITSAGGSVPANTRSITQWDYDYERDATMILARAGIETQVNDSLMLICAVGLDLITNNSELNLTNNVTDNTAGGVTVRTYNNTMDMLATYTASTYYFPVGLEWQATSWLSARLGSTYMITKVSEQTLEAVTTSYNAAGNVTNVNTEKVILDEVFGGNTIEPNTDAVTFYSGVGFNVSDNLTVDVTNVAAGVNVLDMNNWQLGATLKFQ